METFLIIVPSIITGLVSLAVCVINNRYQQARIRDEYIKKNAEVTAKQESTMQQMEASLQQTIAILDCKFDALVEKVNKHNQLIERVYKLESDTGILKEKQSVANHRLETLEKKVQ